MPQHALPFQGRGYTNISSSFLVVALYVLFVRGNTYSERVENSNVDLYNSAVEGNQLKERASKNE